MMGASPVAAPGMAQTETTSGDDGWGVLSTAHKNNDEHGADWLFACADRSAMSSHGSKVSESAAE